VASRKKTYLAATGWSCSSPGRHWNDIPILMPGAPLCQPVPADDVHSVPAPAPPLPPPVILPARKPKRLRRRTSASSALWFDQEPPVSGSCATGPEADQGDARPEPAAPPAPVGYRTGAGSLSRGYQPRASASRSPKNPFCSICARAHARPIYHRKGARLRKVEQLGTSPRPTMWIADKRKWIGFGRPTRSIDSWRDLYSGLIQTYP
jgi:hypothetical protein